MPPAVRMKKNDSRPKGPGKGECRVQAAPYRTRQMSVSGVSSAAGM